MTRRYRRRRGIHIGPMQIVILLVVLAAVGFLLLRGPDRPEDAQQEGLPNESQTQDRQPEQTEPAEPQDAQGTDSKPAQATTASGIACTLTRLGEDAIHTGELILVNNWTAYHFPEEQELVCIYEEKSDSYIVARTDTLLAPVAMEALDAMMDAFREQGGSKTVNVVAGHRTAEFQQHLFDQSAQRNGLEHAEKYVAKPGGSEHHTGFVVDFSILNSDGTSADYDGAGEYAWINENCHKYGYIVRYEAGKEELTGIWDEPWHFRYLGVPHATKVAELGVCMEEYMDYLKDYTFEGEHLTIDCVEGKFEVWYTRGTEVYLPNGGEYYVSGNNTDGVIVTCRTP